MDKKGWRLDLLQGPTIDLVPHITLFHGATTAVAHPQAIQVASVRQGTCTPMPPPLRLYSRPGLLLLVNGSCTLRCLPMERRLDGPRLVVLPSVTTAELHFDGQTNCFVVSLAEHVLRSVSALEPAFESLFSESRELSFGGVDAGFEELRCCIAGLIRELQAPAAAGAIAAEAHLQLLLTSALRCVERAFPMLPALKSESKRAGRLAEDFLRLASANHRQHWRLSDYARALHVSMGHLRASCVKATGASPVQMIHGYIMREAKRRLMCTELPISAIAFDLGFNDAAYFSRLFHSKCGVSPKQYRSSCGPGRELEK
jgi:AraC family transcriptional regulator, transcriptional activator of pobA